MTNTFAKEFNVIAQIYANAYDLPIEKVKTSLRFVQEKFLRNKGWLLKLFPQDGRIIYNVAAGNNKEIIEIARFTVRRWAVSNGFLPIDKLVRFNAIAEDVLTEEEILSNRVAERVTYHGVTAFPGTKATKFLRAVLVELGYARSDVERFVVYLSRLIDTYKSLQRNAAVVLSINPLDIALMSEVCSYQSCTAIGKGHAYTTAPLAYMQDECTAIAYAYYNFENAEVFGVDLGRQPYKVWRQLIYFDRHNLAAVLCRVYGNVMPHFEDATKEIVVDVLTQYAVCEGEITPEVHEEPYLVVWYEKKLTTAGNPYGETKYARAGVRIEAHEMVYLDEPQGAVRLHEGAYPEVYVGAAVRCIECGDSYVNRADTLICYDCRTKYTCDLCGKEVRGVRFTGPDNTLLCEECFDTNVVMCSSCLTPLWRWQAVVGEKNDFLCKACASASRCSVCGKARDNLQEIEGRKLCLFCVWNNAVECGMCYTLVFRENALFGNGRYYCQSCAQKYDLFRRCVTCGNEIWYGNVLPSGNCLLCAIQKSAGLV